MCKDAISLPDGANAANRARIHVAHLISFAPPSPASKTCNICCYAACPQRGSPNLAGLNPSLSDLSNNLSLEEEGRSRTRGDFLGLGHKERRRLLNFMPSKCPPKRKEGRKDNAIDGQPRRPRPNFAFAPLLQCQSDNVTPRDLLDACVDCETSFRVLLRRIHITACMKIQPDRSRQFNKKVICATFLKI